MSTCSLNNIYLNISNSTHKLKYNLLEDVNGSLRLIKVIFYLYFSYIDFGFVGRVWVLWSLLICAFFCIL